MDVFLKESDRGHLMLVDGNGEDIGVQNRSKIEQVADGMTEATVTFLLQPQDQMYKGEENGVK